MMNVWFKKCPKCQGDLMRNPSEGITGCLQCSRILSSEEEQRILGIEPPPQIVEPPLAPVKRGRPRKNAA